MVGHRDFHDPMLGSHVVEQTCQAVRLLALRVLEDHEVSILLQDPWERIGRTLTTKRHGFLSESSQTEPEEFCRGHRNVLVRVIHQVDLKGLGDVNLHRTVEATSSSSQNPWLEEV